MILLTLDLSSRVGWTLGPASDPRFSFGTFVLPKTGEDIGAFAAAYNGWLNGWLGPMGVNFTVFESPILPKMTMLATLRKLYGLAWHTEFACARRGILCEEAPLGPVTQFMTGRMVWSKGQRKSKMVEAAKLYGYDVKTDDEADAIGVRLWTISKKWPDLMRNFGIDLGALGAAASQMLKQPNTEAPRFD